MVNVGRQRHSLTVGLIGKIGGRIRVRVRTCHLSVRGYNREDLKVLDRGNARLLEFGLSGLGLGLEEVMWEGVRIGVTVKNEKST